LQSRWPTPHRGRSGLFSLGVGGRFRVPRSPLLPRPRPSGEVSVALGLATLCEAPRVSSAFPRRPLPPDEAKGGGKEGDSGVGEWPVGSPCRAASEAEHRKAEAYDIGQRGRSRRRAPGGGLRKAPAGRGAGRSDRPGGTTAAEGPPTQQSVPAPGDRAGPA